MVKMKTLSKYYFIKMAAYYRNDSWKEDNFLKKEMAKYVTQGLQHDLVHALMYEKKALEKGNFTSKGPNWVRTFL
jgi:hypothetical protein